MAKQKSIDGANLQLALKQNNEKMKGYIDASHYDIKKYQKYVNTELDYCYANASYTNTLNYTESNIPFNVPFQSYNSNMETDKQGMYVVLKANKQYNIQFTSRIGGNKTNVQTSWKIISEEGETIVSGSYSIDSTGPYNDMWDGKCINSIANVKKDTKIYVQCYGLKGTVNSIQCELVIIEINRQITIDPVEHINATQGIEDAPVGHIISHMGTIAPKHYLICDGATYNIEEYPYLAEHILTNFGKYNYFGGDGETTFRVPDLRGEFLRGTGTATRDSGSGAAVGQHQEPTQHAKIQNFENKTVAIDVGTPEWKTNNSDKIVTIDTKTRYYKDVGIQNSASTSSVITSRPTNTAVLYCIKYEPTYFMNTYNTNYMQPSLYSEEERMVGCWIDGKPLYEKVVKVTMPNKTIGTSTPHGIENLDTLTNFSLNWYDSEDKAWYDRFRMWISSSVNYSISNELNIDSKNINITPNGNNIIDWSSRTTNAFCKLQYTKTTDEPNSFTNSILKESYVKLDSTCTDEELQQAIADIVEEINADPVIEPEQSIADIPMTIPELYEEDTPTIIPETIPDEESEQVVEPEEVTPEVTDEPETEQTEVTEGGTNNESE